ncbi:zinc finger protein 862-like [Lineus longissimus]|uniref:zinc finger protein 862-like n=1 Tax=Lineus longissimus TaxID=88925 RepID=UPI00315D3CDF
MATGDDRQRKPQQRKLSFLPCTRPARAVGQVSLPDGIPHKDIVIDYLEEDGSDSETITDEREMVPQPRPPRPPPDANDNEPALKKPKTKVNYDSKFRKEWLKEFPWLQWEPDKGTDGLMFCKDCRANPALARSNLGSTAGCDTHKHDTLAKHKISRAHILCRDACLKKTSKAALPQVFNRQVTNNQLEVEKQLEVKFNIAYNIAKEEIPFTKFKPWLFCHKKCGLPINPTYDNDIKCAEFVGAIADHMREILNDQLKKVRYLSIIIDGETDVSNKECEIVYARILELGWPVNRLVGQQEVEDAHATGVLEAADKTFQDLASYEDNAQPNVDWKEKLVCMGSDGASVNLGHRNGVIEKLRLELAVLVLQRDVPMVRDIYDTLFLVWKTYHYSTKSQRDLEKLGKELGVKVLKVSNVKGTRWLPHVQRALDVFMMKESGTTGQFNATYVHMEHLAATHPKADISGRAKKQAIMAVKHMIQQLEDLRTTPKRRGNMERFLNDDATQQGEFQGIKLKGDIALLIEEGFGHQRLAAGVRNTIDIALREIRNRFSALLGEPLGDNITDESAAAVRCLNMVFNHDTWPSAVNDLESYGYEEMEFLLRYFVDLLQRNGCQVDEVQGEYSRVKTLVNGQFIDKGVSALWHMMLIKEPYQGDFKNMLHLVEIMLVIPISSAQCERGFSAQRRIKSDDRAGLHVSTTSDLIRISFEGCSLADFNPKPVIRKWFNSGQGPRRPNLYRSWPAIVCVGEDTNIAVSDD